MDIQFVYRALNHGVYGLNVERWTFMLLFLEVVTGGYFSTCLLYKRFPSEIDVNSSFHIHEIIVPWSLPQKIAVQLTKTHNCDRTVIPMNIVLVVSLLFVWGEAIRRANTASSPCPCDHSTRHVTGWPIMELEYQDVNKFFLTKFQPSPKFNIWSGGTSSVSLWWDFLNQRNFQYPISIDDANLYDVTCWSIILMSWRGHGLKTHTRLTFWKNSANFGANAAR